MGARSPEQLERNLASLNLRLEPDVVGLLADAGDEVKRMRNMTHHNIALTRPCARRSRLPTPRAASLQVKRKLGSNLDPYEAADSTRIV